MRRTPAARGDSLPRDAGATGPRRVTVARIGGIAIEIDASWLILALLVLANLALGWFPLRVPDASGWAYALVGTAGTLLFFVSVLTHELAHALLANRLGHDVRRITLFVFGGMTHLDGEARSARTEIAVAGIGPLTSFALAGLFAAVGALLPGPPLALALLGWLAAVNLILGVFNLLPGFPLDGGRLVRGVLWLRSGDLPAATARAARWGSTIALGLVALGILEALAGGIVGGLWMVFIGLFLRGAAQQSWQSVRIEQALAGAHVRDVMVAAPLRTVPADLPLDRAVDEYFSRDDGGLPVADDGAITGLVSLDDVQRCPPGERPAHTVREVMARAGPAIEVPAAAPVIVAMRRLVDSGSAELLVTDGGRVVGMVARAGIARFVRARTAVAGEPA